MQEMIEFYAQHYEIVTLAITILNLTALAVMLVTLRKTATMNQRTNESLRQMVSRARELSRIERRLINRVLKEGGCQTLIGVDTWSAEEYERN